MKLHITSNCFYDLWHVTGRDIDETFDKFISLWKEENSTFIFQNKNQTTCMLKVYKKGFKKICSYLSLAQHSQKAHFYFRCKSLLFSRVSFSLWFRWNQFIQPQNYRFTSGVTRNKTHHLPIGNWGEGGGGSYYVLHRKLTWSVVAG